jgi:diguanylate cyclase (GGDEF)-like protein
MNNEKHKETLRQLKQARHELFLFYEIGNAMRTSLKLEHILYAILTCVTAKDGLGFDRAFLFLVNSDKTKLVGKMAIGPKSGQKPDKIWHQIKQEKKDLSDLVQSYEQFSRELHKGLSSLVKKISIPLKEDAGIPALTALENMLHKITLSVSAKKVNKDFLDTLQLSDFIALPLRGKNEVHGVLIADNPITKKIIGEDDVRILSLFANQAGLAIDNSKYYENTRKLTELDSLTLLYNHGKFQHLLTNEVKKSLRYKSNLSLLFIDIDFFKQFNDTHGHQAGDQILRDISKILKNNARTSDMVARYGGEEFAIICVRTKIDDALRLAERIKKAVAEHNFCINNCKEECHLTVTIGIASLPSSINDKNQLIKQADKALYRGKAKGRNRIEVSN